VRVAFISDVHSNIYALEAVLDDISRWGIDQIIHAGDIVGYGAFPNQTIEMFRRHRIMSIVGNHDTAAISASSSGMNPVASEAVLWTAQNLTPASLEYLKGLRPHAEMFVGAWRTCVHHGSPRNGKEYIFEEDATPDLLRLCGARLLVLGHTHVPYVKHTEAGYIVNPGSVGQPRDEDPRASYLICDSTKESFTLRKVDYDIEATVAAIRNARLPAFLGERLRSGI
jgi:predicted phosphodiesterase